jgi:hypothetical protein
MMALKLSSMEATHRTKSVSVISSSSPVLMPVSGFMAEAKPWPSDTKFSPARWIGD